jgi:ATP-dependent helicase/nuclease subunit A
MMDQGFLTKYNASAGSGKTYKLTGIYLSKLFDYKKGYKKILAVTFTNKAAAEMKSKILSQLFSLSKGDKTGIGKSISEAGGKPVEILMADSKEILRNVLHDYSAFHVGTIDSFFQKILKAFTREIGLQQGYIIELDNSLILKHAVEEMLADTAKDTALRNWITRYVNDRVEEGKSWNFKKDILKLSEEIFKEKFRLLSINERARLRNRELLDSYVNELKTVKTDFWSKMEKYADECLDILTRHNVVDNMFLRGGRGGVPSFLEAMKKGVSKIAKPPNATVSRVLEDPPVWTSGSGPSPELKAALEDGFGELFFDALKYYLDQYIKVNTAVFILDNIYILGILSDIMDHVHLLTSSENRFLLSDAGELLWLIIKDDQTPFIYEKVGNSFENFMIDEFQDTSLIQWNNFKPLIENSMAEGRDNLVVGDVKQSIYRWRNSDWEILDSLLEKQFDQGRSETVNLETNWRSRENIISFNNTLFELLPRLTDISEVAETGNRLLYKLYDNVRQYGTQDKKGGFVGIEFISEEDDKFDNIVLNKLPSLLEDLQDRGYHGSDIGILVRTNKEGADVLKKILEYQSGSDFNRDRFNVISNDSLLLVNSPAVRFIISLLSGLYQPDDKLSQATILRNWMSATGADPLDIDLGNTESEIQRVFSTEYADLLQRIRQMSLYEAVETIILSFGLGKHRENTAYLNSFQDYVLEFAGNTSADVVSFLDWWETTGINKSIILSDQQNAIRIMTIHKAKGLEFKVVILPFVSWSLGHRSNAPTLWLSPEISPFNKLGLVPVRYKSDLKHSHFANDYYNETYLALVDNINLLYVAFTRAIDCLFAFAPCKSGTGSTSVAQVLLSALRSETTRDPEKPGLNLRECYSEEEGIFSYGDLPGAERDRDYLKQEMIEIKSYFVNHGIKRLHLRLHGYDRFTRGGFERQARINYGNLMHEVFESIVTLDDIPGAVNNMVIEGKIAGSDRREMENRIKEAVFNQTVKEWFKPGLVVMNESEILRPDGLTKRPDRIVIDKDRVTVVDFKFGKEKKEYENQVSTYRKLLLDMDYQLVDAFLWYVDSKKIIKVI